MISSILKTRFRSNYAAFLRELKGAHGISGVGLKIDKELLDQAPQFKIVSNISVGYDNLDLPQLSERGIMATNTPEVLNKTVTDTVMGLILATARRMPELDSWVKSRESGIAQWGSAPIISPLVPLFEVTLSI